MLKSKIVAGVVGLIMMCSTEGAKASELGEERAVGRETLDGRHRIDGGALARPEHPRIRALQDGAWRISWQGEHATGLAVVSRDFGPDGRSRSAEEFQPAARLDELPRHAELVSGAVDVAERFRGHGRGWGLFAQLYDSSGALSGHELPVHDDGGGRDHLAPAVAALADGGFVVVWQSHLDDWDLFMRYFDAAGRALGASRRVPTPPGDQVTPAVAASGRSIAIAWRGELATGGWGIFARMGEDLIFADGFESSDVSAWSETWNPPSAAFTATPDSGAPPLEVTFDASPSSDAGGAIESYGWDFGDGATGAGAVVQHTYPAAGSYAAVLTVTDSDGLSDTALRTIQVQPEMLPPEASFTADPATGEAPLTISFDASASFDPDGAIAVHLWDFGDGDSATGVTAGHVFAQPGSYRVRLTVVDDDGLEDSTSFFVSALPPVVELVSTDPARGEEEVALGREAVLTFDGPLDPASVTAEAFTAQFADQTLPSFLHLSADRTRLTAFFAGPLPESAAIRLVVDGNILRDSLGRAVDGDGDGLPGGRGTVDFTTLSATPLPETRVCGRVLASEAEGEAPLEGVTITLDDGPENATAVTGGDGTFCLDPAPGDRFFVHIDGRTAVHPVPEGAFYPTIGKAWTAVPGTETDVGDIFLPLIAAGSLQPVSATDETEIRLPDSVLESWPELAGVQLIVPPDTLFDDDGTRGGEVGLAPVSPDRLPGPLPDELDLPLVITVQTDGGQNFDQPAPVCLPNLPDPETGATLPAGEASALWSFNHDTGRWMLAGAMTVESGGALVCSDPGDGILAPGWHGTQPGTAGGGGGNDACQQGCLETFASCKRRCGLACSVNASCRVAFAGCSVACENAS